MAGDSSRSGGSRRSFFEQFEEELSAVRKAREMQGSALRNGGEYTDPPPEETGRRGTGRENDAGAEDIAERAGDGSADDVVRRAHEEGLLGLAFSGGGIRSATFNLGVVQRLAGYRLLRRVDYLSTVSGGGYLGGWLSAWVHRESMPAAGGSGSRARPGILEIEKTLSGRSPQPGPGATVEPQAVRWLRQFSNYLTPRVGVLGTDTLTGVATYLRNLILNQSVLVTFGMSLLLLPWFLLALVHEAQSVDGLLWLGSGVMLLSLGAVLAGYETLPAEYGQSVEKPVKGRAGPEDWKRIDQRTQRRYWAMVLLFAAAAVPLGVWITLRPDAFSPSWIIATVVAYGGGALSGWFYSAHQKREQLSKEKTHRRLFRGGWALLAGAALGGMLMLWTGFVQTTEGAIDSPVTAVSVGPLVVLGAILLTVTLHLGLVGRALRESARELWSRHGAHQLRLGIGWLAVAGGAMVGPLLLIWMNDWLAALGGAAWIATTAAGVLAGSSGDSGPRSTGRMTELLARIAPYVFIAGLLLLLSHAGYRYVSFMGETGEQKPSACSGSVDPQAGSPLYDVTIDISGDGHRAQVFEAAGGGSCSFEEYASGSANAAAGMTSGKLLLTSAALLALALFLSYRVDVNVFSFHMFYRNRIERCYMGASNKDRRPHPMTGLDPRDAPKLEDLKLAPGSPGAQRPFPIINTALNITSSRNLAWQERKAASFSFSPMYCGYEIREPGGDLLSCYQPTASYANGKRNQVRDQRISLGLPVTISGAAASPNAGYHSSTATAFLMTVFNVRLGWWMQNPRTTGVWETPGPRLSLRPLVQELAGMTTDASDYVYLSDGGHFENLGIYELVRRRCRYIIACDAGCDPKYTFEDLGNAVRKCQIDLGIEIEIEPRAIRPDADTGRSEFHCAVGRIHYDRRDPDGHPGYLLYVKSSLTGDEPVDVLQYAAENPGFPHQTTADQWYSESQFESYRKLGFHAVSAVLDDAMESVTRNNGASGVDLEDLFSALREQWYAPSTHVRSAFTRQGRTLENVFELIRNDESLSYLDWQVYPEWRYLMGRGSSEPVDEIPTALPEEEEQIRAGFYLCNYLLQVMEDVYHDLNLEQDHTHPDNRGWMNLFHHWSWAGMFRVTWAISASTYGARFQQFCRRHLYLWMGEVVLDPEIGVDEALDEDVSPLNFVERAMLRDLLKGQRKDATGEWGVKRLSLLVSCEAERQERSDYRFPIAFAIVAKNTGHYELIYYRVQDHLRKIGLGRMGLAVLREDVRKQGELNGSGLKLRLPGRERFEELFHSLDDADVRALQRLWYSVEKAAKDRGTVELDARV